MKKSVYSLVLMDEVVRAIDQMAYENNTSRSNFINQILAEKVMLITPEMRMKDIFDKIIDSMEDEKKFQVRLQQSDYCLSIMSILDYKYNPTIRYFFELYRTADKAIGELKITSRTQSRDLQRYLYEFFQYFSKLEQVYMARYFPKRPTPHFISDGDGRFIRELILIDQHGITTDTIALAMGNYVQMLDSLLEIYLTHLHDIEMSTKKIKQVYSNFLNSNPTLI